MDNLFTQALGIYSPWLVKDVEFNNKQLSICIDFKRGTQFVDGSDDTKAYGVYDTKMKKYRHMNFIEHECHLHVRVSRIKQDDGKGSQPVVDFVEALEQQKGNKEQVKSVSCDMSSAFIKGIRENLPNAKITFDKFNIIKIINEGVDRVRRAEVKENPMLKGTRYLFLKNEQPLSEKQQQKKAELELADLNLQFFEAMRMRETFQQIYQAKTVADFEQLLSKWDNWVSQCDLPAMVETSKTTKNHWQGVVQWKLSSINNGLLEGLNSIIQAAKRKARGYDKKHFKTMAYLLKSVIINGQPLKNRPNK